MTIEQFILYNGEYLPKDNPIFNYTNRAFAYGDALFETIHANGTTMQFFLDHLERLKNGMNLIKMEIPHVFSSGSIEQFITRLLNKNRLLKGARIRLTVFRDCEGKYTPQSNNISYIVSAEKLDEYEYFLNEKGLKIDIFPDIKKPVNLLSNIKSTNALIYTMAGLYAKDNNLDDALLINENEHLVEAISSNIFMIKDDFLVTPPLYDGCVAGIIRKQILKIGEELNLKVSHQASLKISALEHADEVFLTNAITGVRWVAAYKSRRYYNTISKQILRELNKMAFGANS